MTRPLHIVIDARWIFDELSGIGLHTRELIKALAAQPSPHRFTLLFDNRERMARTAAQTAFTQHQGFSATLLNHGPLSPFDQWQLPRVISDLNADVYHSTNYTTPLKSIGRTRLVVTLYDLIPMLFREYAPKSIKNRLYPIFNYLMHRAANASDLVITISESTRRDILAHLVEPPTPPERVVVIPCGVRATYQPAAKTPRDHLTFLYVGRRDPYKNLPMLIEAFAAVKKQEPTVRLRVIGSDDPRYPEATKRAHELHVNDSIIWDGYVTDDALIQAYQQADVFVLPSRYEGFGLPVLEAMACGTPVICSNTSSLPEVGGDAVVYMDPAQPASLTKAMLDLARDASMREDRARRGIARAAQFTWAETARKTLAAYERVAGA